MMSRLLLLSAILILSITGCSTTNFHFKNSDSDVGSTTKSLFEGSDSHVDDLLKDNEYRIAISYIDQLDKKDPNYKSLKKRRPDILKMRLKYEKKTFKKSRKLLKAGRLADSIELLDGAVKRIPESKILNQELKEQRSERAEKLTQLLSKITLLEAHAINDGQALYQQLYLLDSNTPLAPEMIQKRASESTTKLLMLATQEVDAKETLKARKLLKLAGQITPEIRRTSKFRKLMREIDEIEKGITLAIKKNREIALEKQIKDFNRLYQKHELTEAQKVLKRIEKRFKNSKTIRKLRRKLDKTVSFEINKYMQSGQDFYSREEIEPAINEWGNVLLLEPDNQAALEHISRAVKVLEQLQQVQRNRQR